MIKYVLDENVNFCEETNKKIDLLNHEFFNSVELAKSEEESLIWLCGWNTEIVHNIAAAFKKRLFHNNEN